MQNSYKSNIRSGIYSYKQSIGVSGETKVLFSALSRGERYIASRFRIGRFGEIDLITLAQSGAVHCYEVRTTALGSKSRYISDQFQLKKISRVRNCANLFEMYHVKQFMDVGIGVYAQQITNHMPKHHRIDSVVPILASVTGETVTDKGLVWSIKYFDLNGDILFEEGIGAY